MQQNVGAGCQLQMSWLKHRHRSIGIYTALV